MSDPVLLVRQLLDLVLFLFLVCLLARLVVDWVQVFARDWRPQGVVLVLVEGIYTVTDPPIRAVRKVLPPLRIGPVALDLGFLVVLLTVSILRSII